MSEVCIPDLQSENLQHITIKNLSCSFSRKKWRFWESYYVVVSMGDTQTGSSLNKTKSDKAIGGSLKWAESFHFSSHKDSRLTLAVYRYRQNASSTFVGSVSDSISLLVGDTDGAVTIERDLDSNLGIRIKFTASSHATLTKQGKDAIAPIQKEHSFATFLEFVDTFQKLTEPIAEVHPWAQMAHKMLFGAFKAIDGQIQLDDNLNNLFNSFSCFYEIVSDIENVGLPKDDRRRDLLHRLGLQMAEVVYFVCDYCKTDSFAKRIFMNALADTESKIEEFEQILKALKDEFFAASATQTEVKVTRILQAVKDLAITIDLNGMSYAAETGVERAKMCLVGTRVQILKEIIDWVNSKDGDQIMLLLGGAGTGKSSIAHTVGNHFSELSRLGSFFFFSRSKPNNNLRVIFPHISRSLAEMHDLFCATLAPSIKHTGTRTTRDLDTQFEKFICEPAKALADKIYGPIIIIIDALDEAADDSERGRELLLDILSTRITRLPSNFRILITSRAEEHVERAFENQSSVRTIRMDDISPESTSTDIAKYIRNTLSKSSGTFFEGIDEVACQELTRRSDGLFQWAHVVCDFIRTGRPGTNYLGRYKSMIGTSEKGTGVVGDKRLDSLYRTILINILSPENEAAIDPETLDRFRVIMTRVMMTVEPLSIASLDKLLEKSRTTLQHINASEILRYLGAVLSGVRDTASPVRPLHTSFRDFLTDKSRSGQFFVDIDDVPTCADMAQSLLRIMINELKFNIFDITTSYNPNPSYDVTKQYIPEYLSYSCRFWANHLPPKSPHWAETWKSPQYPLRQIELGELVEMVHKFFNGCFLYWLEVQSGLRRVDYALVELRKVLKWLKSPNKAHASAIAVTDDAEQFTACFAACIATSIPHIYLSALPFAPQESVVAKHYNRQVVHAILIETGRLENWPVCLNVISGHTSWVTSIAVSPDGACIASGSQDKTVRTWNAADGTPMRLPFAGHTEAVTSIAFSPDGTRIVSGSQDKKICVWNVADGTIVAGPFDGHTDWVDSIAFSPDGAHIASSSGCTIQIWNAADGLPSVVPLEEHTSFVMSVKFSPDGTRIASGSQDRTVRVWNAVDGSLAAGPLEGHTGTVWTVAFSPDGNLVASGSADKTIRVWNAANGALVAKPFQGHTWDVNSIAFSPDGTCIISGSSDRTVRVWNASNGILLAKPFEGHNYSVLSVVFSSDSTRIFSGSSDNTVRVWSAACILPVSVASTGHSATGTATSFLAENTQVVSDFHDETNSVQNEAYVTPMAEPCKEHTGAVASVALSPDGTCIASGSYDNTVAIWNAADGLPVAGPFLGHTGQVTSVAFSPDGNRIASGSHDQMIRVWNVADGTPGGRLCKGHTDLVNSVAFSPDSTRIVSGSHDKTVRVWSAVDGLPIIEPIEGHSDFVWSVAFSLDGTHIVSGSRDGTLRVWNAVDGSPATVGLFEGHTGGVNSVAFSPDGTHIASGSFDNTVRVWNTAEGISVVEPLQGHFDSVESVAFSPDGTRIISGSRDHTIRIWNVADGTLVARPYRGHNDYVNSVVFSLDGTRIISGSADKTIRIWNLYDDSLANSLKGDPQTSGSASRPLDDIPVTPSLSGSIEFNGSTPLKDGWILGPNGELVLYVPPDNRTGLWRPGDVAIIGRHLTRLNFTNFVHGTDWEKCFRSNS